MCTLTIYNANIQYSIHTYCTQYTHTVLNAHTVLVSQYLAAWWFIVGLVRVFLSLNISSSASDCWTVLQSFSSSTDDNCWTKHPNCWMKHPNCWMKHSNCWMKHSNCWMKHSNCWTKNSNCWTKNSNCWTKPSNCWTKPSNCWIKCSTVGWNT